MLFWHPFLHYFLPLLLFLFILLKLFSSSNKNHPPSPPKLPIIGNLHQIGSLPYHSLHSLAQKYGPLMLIHLGNKPTLVVSSSEAAREIMKTHDVIFSNRPKSTIADKFFYNSNDIAFSPYGEYWRQMRSICVLQLLSNKRVQSFQAVREQEIALMIEEIRRSCSDSPPVVNLSKLVAALTNNVVCRVALGKKYSSYELGDKFRELLREFVELLGVFDVGDYVPWLRWVNYLSGVYGRADKVARELDKFLESVVEEHVGRERSSGDQSEAGTQDFVDVLLDIQRENTTAFPIQRESVKAIILDVFAAGTDTTYSSLEWVLTELLKHPRVLKELQYEVGDIGKGKEISITEDDLERMHYLKAVIKESLRLHPPIPLLVPRESTQDVKVMGYDIAVGTQVITNAWAIGRDPSIWDEPEEFKPERFINTSVDFKGHDFHFIPFGAGRRGCPGIQFAMSVEELALANLMYHFDFSLPEGVTSEDLDVSETSGLTAHKRLPLLVNVSLGTQLKYI